MPWPLLVVLVACGALSGSLADCPQVCECKWRGGKESAICRAANLTAVPKHLDAGTQLLDVTSNWIPSLARDEFHKAGLVNLQKLYLARCRLSTLDRFSFRHLINLVELDLSYNALPAVPSHAFDCISELRELRLSGNPILKITNNAFLKVPQLVRLELSDCRIGVVEPRGLAGLERSLEWLKLDHNRLAGVRPDTFTDMQSLHGLELDGNPWNCSCLLRPLRSWMLRKNVPSSVVPVCSAPPRLSGRAWTRMDLDDFACGPRIRAVKLTASGVEGNNATLSCVVQGTPDPAVRWLYRNRVVANLSSTAPYAVARKLFVVRTNDSASSLAILALDAQDAGVYVCAAENRAGKVEANITLTVTRRPVDSHLSGKVVVASVVVAVLFVLASCLVALCLWSLRKRHSLWVEQTRGARLRHDDHYEKIEMNHKSPVSAANHTSPVKFAPVKRKSEELEVSALAQRRGGRKGRYRGVPTCDDDEMGYDGEVETPTPSHAGTPWTVHRSSDDTISSSNPSDSRSADARGAAASQEAARGGDRGPGGGDAAAATPGAGAEGRPHGSGAGAARNGLAVGGDVRALPQHVLRKQVLGDSGGSLYTSLMDDAADRSYPDLLQPQADSLPSSLGALGPLGGLGSGALVGGTLPRRPHPRTHHRRGSESPLLTDSRYGSSGGSSSSGLASGYPAHYQRSSSSLNLASSPVAPGQGSGAGPGLRGAYGGYVRRNPSLPGSPCRERTAHDRAAETPILAALSSGPGKRFGSGLAQPSVGGAMVSPSSYDYHAAQLERFLEEYRSLHDQLSKMKQTCDSLRQPDRDAGAGNPKSILKKKAAPLSPDLRQGQDPRQQEPLYWVPRASLARRYSGGDFFPS